MWLRFKVSSFPFRHCRFRGAPLLHHSSTPIPMRTRASRQRIPKTSAAATTGHPDLQPAIRVVMMPRDANYLGTIFGGVILNSLDLAGAIEAQRHTTNKVVTVAMHEVNFIAPVFV